MADSNITKRALANALKEQLEVEPFKKISISDICDRCEMNRKSFYYHFRDKYDLVNWLFDVEFTAYLNKLEQGSRWALFEAACRYFYENRSFYCKIFPLRGQDSFFEHFRAYLQPLLRAPLEEILQPMPVLPLYVDFFTDSIAYMIERWLLDKDCLPPAQFVALLQDLVQRTAAYVCNERKSS